VIRWLVEARAAEASVRFRADRVHGNPAAVDRTDHGEDLEEARAEISQLARDDQRLHRRGGSHGAAQVRLDAVQVLQYDNAAPHEGESSPELAAPFGRVLCICARVGHEILFAGATLHRFAAQGGRVSLVARSARTPTSPRSAPLGLMRATGSL